MRARETRNAKGRPFDIQSPVWKWRRQEEVPGPRSSDFLWRDNDASINRMSTSLSMAYINGFVSLTWSVR